MSYIRNKQHVYINSNDRLYGTNSDFSIQLQIDSPDYNRVVLLKAVIPKSYYLVQNGYNTFTVEEGVTTYTITIDPGNYSRRSFQTAIQSALNNTGTTWTYTVSYPNTLSSPDTGKYTFTVTGNSGVQPTFIFTNNLYEPMGFDINSSNPLVGDSLTSTNVIKLQAEDALYLHSDIVLGKGDNILECIYLNAQDYSNITFEQKSPYENSKIINRTIGNVYRFYLTDETNVPIDTNGLNMNLHLLFFTENNYGDLLSDYLKKLSL